MENNVFSGYAGGKIVNREEILDAVKQSSNELRLLGTVAFNLPWNEEEFCKSLQNKYTADGSHYEISVIAESDPTLQSYALTSGLAPEAAGVPIATLEEIRQNATLRLREKFLKANAAGIEPVEDKYRQELDSLFARRFAENICKELYVRNIPYSTFFGETENAPEDSVVGLLLKCCHQLGASAFQKSDLAMHYLGKGDYFNIGRISKSFTELVNRKLKQSLNQTNEAKTERKTEAIFDFCDAGINIPFDDPTSGKICHFKVAPKDLRNACMDCFLRVLSIYAKRDYDLIKDYASKEAYVERMAKQASIEKDVNKKQRLFIKEVYHPIPVQMMMIDGVFYAAISPLTNLTDSKYLYIGDSAKTAAEDVNRFEAFKEYVGYFNAYLNSQYCTEETNKLNKKEVIYNYTSNHTIIGQMPRDSFYGSDNYKLVMWALVFDRKGRILIHRRANNAKDNQGLWDKSVGGHIAITDRDTIAGASREIAEELYKVEEEEQSHANHSNNRFNDVRSDLIIYLGKWKETRYPNFGSSLNLESNEFYLFSFESRMTEQPIDSMRILPNGTRIKAKCFADLYFTITSKNFDLSELKNSKYLVLPPQLIKRCAKERVLSDDLLNEIQSYNPNVDLSDISDHFDVTPDLDYIINSPEWDNEITKFSIRVEEAFAH